MNSFRIPNIINKEQTKCSSHMYAVASEFTVKKDGKGYLMSASKWIASNGRWAWLHNPAHIAKNKALEKTVEGPLGIRVVVTPLWYRALNIRYSWPTHFNLVFKFLGNFFLVSDAGSGFLCWVVLQPQGYFLYMFYNNTY